MQLSRTTFFNFYGLYIDIDNLIYRDMHDMYTCKSQMCDTELKYMEW